MSWNIQLTGTRDFVLDELFNVAETVDAGIDKLVELEEGEVLTLNLSGYVYDNELQTGSASSISITRPKPAVVGPVVDAGI